MSNPYQRIGAISTPFGRADICVGRYPSGGAVAVQLYLRNGELLITFSTNLVPYGGRLADDEFLAKTWSENEPFVQPMLDTGLFEVTGRTRPSGYVVAQVWRIRDTGHVPRTARRPRPAPAAAA